MSGLLRWVRHMTARHSIVLWICFGFLLFDLTLLASMPFGTRSETDDWAASVATMVGVSIVACSAICVTVIWRAVRGPEVKRGFPKDRAITVLVAFPAVVTAMMSPWLLTGLLDDSTTSGGASLFLWLVLAYGALVFGFMLNLFLFYPAWNVAKGVVNYFRGGEVEVGIVAAGVVMLLFDVVVFSLAGSIDSFGDETMRVMLGALFGFDAGHRVTNSALLWVARIIFFGFFGTTIYLQVLIARDGHDSPVGQHGARR